MAKVILGLSGPLASGKAACQKYLTEKYNASSAKFSTPLRDIIKRIYIPNTRENMQKLSLALREQFGGNILAKIIAEDVKNDEQELIIIDGVRRLQDIENLKNLPGFYLVAIDADPKIRYERMKLRNENEGDAEKSFEDFIEDGKREAELQIPEVMAQANFKLDNNGSFDDLYQQIEEMMTKVKK